MSLRENDVTAARSKILESSRQFFELAHSPKVFVPGETYVPVTTKVMDADDLALLVDASLDMWLTTGRYGREFEATIPQFFGRKTSALLVNSGSSANLVAVSSLGAPMMKDVKLKPLEKGD